MVSGGGRHATSGVWALVEAALRAVSVVRGAGGDRALSCAGPGVREVARRLGRAASTISRELRRNAATRGGGLDYRATAAQWHAERAARRPKPAKLVTNAALRTYVQDRLAGVVVSSGRGCRPRAGRVLERPPARASEGPAVGQGVEPGADRPALAARLSRR